MEKHIASSRPRALELRELKKQRERIRREEIARVLEKYKDVAKEYKDFKIFLYENSRQLKKEHTIVYGVLAVVSIAFTLLAIFVYDIFLLFAAITLFSVLHYTNYIAYFAEQDFVKIISKNNELVIAGNQDRIQKLTALEIEAAIESWLLEQEEKEIENAEPDDIEEVYR